MLGADGSLSRGLSLFPRLVQEVPCPPVVALCCFARELARFRAHAVPRDPRLSQRVRGAAVAFVEESQERVLGADIVVVELPGGLVRQVDDPQRVPGQRDRLRGAAKAADGLLLDSGADVARQAAEPLQGV